MKKFEKFSITGHTFDPETLVATFSYSFDNEVHFTETIDFTNNAVNPIENIGPDIIDNLLSHLSLALAVSYYKLYPTDNLYIENFSLNEDQISYWKQFYINGL